MYNRCCRRLLPLWLSRHANLSHLYIISILLGLAFGAHWSLLPGAASGALLWG